MLPVTWTTTRLFLHVLAATIWVGGQLTLAGLVPGLRAISADAPRIVARRFNQIAWPAFVVLVVTGIWNVAAVHRTDSAYAVTMFAKIAVVGGGGGPPHPPTARSRD
jgi:putative copper export protein